MSRIKHRDWLWEIIACPDCGSPLESGTFGTELVCTNRTCSYQSYRVGRRFDLLPSQLDRFQKAEDHLRSHRLERYAGLVERLSESQYTRFQLLNVLTGYVFVSQYLFFRDDFVKRYKLAGRGLEIGGGTGQQSGFIKLFFPETEMVMSDVAPTSISVGEQLADLLCFDVDYFVVCDAQRLPFVPNSFDFIFSSAMLHHLGDIKASLEQAYSVLKPDGRWYIIGELAIGSVPRLFWNSRWGPKGKLARTTGVYENSYTLQEWKRFFSESNFKVLQAYFHREPRHKLSSWYNAAYYAMVSMLPVGLVKLGIPCEICFVLEKGQDTQSKIRSEGV